MDATTRQNIKDIADCSKFVGDMRDVIKIRGRVILRVEDDAILNLIGSNLHAFKLFLMVQDNELHSGQAQK